MTKFTRLYIISALLLSAFAVNSVAAEPKIVVSIEPIAKIASAITGTRENITTLIGNSQDPHSFELTPSSLEAINKADVLIFNGLGLEYWASKLDRDTQSRVLYLSDVLKGKAGDPHTWLDPVLVKEQAKFLSAKLCWLSPTQCKEYTFNTMKFISDLDTLTAEIGERIKGWKRRSFVAYHPSWSRFAERFVLFQEGVLKENDASSPTTQYYADLLVRVKEKGISVFVLDRNVPQTEVQGFLTDAKLKCAILDDLGKPGESYISFLRSNVDLLEVYMKGDADTPTSNGVTKDRK